MMRRLLYVLTALLLVACNAEQQYSTRYPCSFVFYAKDHINTNALTISLSNPGQFVIVEPKQVNGLTHLMLTPNSGTWETFQTDIPLSASAIENERLSYDHMGACKRLIIGTSNFNGLKAYDGQCPNCLESDGALWHPLSWTDKGQMLVCERCQRKYNPHAEGVPVNGKEGDLRLMEYRIEYNGQKLYVHN